MDVLPGDDGVPRLSEPRAGLGGLDDLHRAVGAQEAVLVGVSAGLAVPQLEQVNSLHSEP